MAMPSKIQKEYVKLAFNHWRQQGFPYYNLDDSEIIRQFNLLQNTSPHRILINNSEIQWSNVGLSLANCFQPAIWSVKSDRYISPIECFNNDDLLKACIEKALKIWPSRYGCNASNLRRMLSSYTNVKRVSNFRPTVAKAIYETFSPNNGHVLDLCSGFGGRLLGSLTLCNNYTGYEPNITHFKGLQRMHDKISHLGLASREIILKNACAEDAISTEKSGKFDLVFTSPPYYSRERYSDDISQSYIRYDSYSSWCKNFLEKLLEESHRVLAKHGLLILNVANTEDAPIYDDVLRLAAKFYKVKKIYQMRLGRLPYRRGNSINAYHYEPIVVFTKRR